jgi:hypothetical protein
MCNLLSHWGQNFALGTRLFSWKILEKYLRIEYGAQTNAHMEYVHIPILGAYEYASLNGKGILSSRCN